MILTIGYIKDLKCFTRVGKCEDENEDSLTFWFCPEDSPMRKMLTL